MVHPNDDQPLTILLLETDDDTRPLLKHNLENIGYQVLIALDRNDALQRAIYSPSIDLILINQVNTPLEEILMSGQNLRTEARLSISTPVVILAENYTTLLEGQNIQVTEYDYVAYLEDAQQLFDLLENLLSS